MDYKGKKVTIMGLGLYEHGSGIEAAKFFLLAGARVLITDLRSAVALKLPCARLKKFVIKHKLTMPIFHLGEHRAEDFKNVDYVIKNPGVRNNSPFLAMALKDGAKIETDNTLFFNLCSAKIIGVTGTRGKSTTSALLNHILKTAGRRVWFGGNNQHSPLEFLPKIKSTDWVVLELSSWALENLTKSPQIAVVTNIYPDHLNTYAGMAEYIAAKENIFRFQKADDVVVLNKNNADTVAMAERASGQVIFFDRIKTANPSLAGEHNEANAAAALVVARRLKILNKISAQALLSFKGLPGRLELIKDKAGVKWYNDTTATSPEGTLAALKTLAGRGHKNIILIAGGADKNLSYQGFGKKISKVAKAVILFPGSATDKFKGEIMNYQMAASMSKAVAMARRLAKKGDQILLSPGAASFNIFKNEYDRGDQFVKLVSAKGLPRDKAGGLASG